MEIQVIPNKPEFESLLELYPPILASKIKPEWYKKLPLEYPDPGEAMDMSTARKCPAIQDIINTGLIIPMWGKFFFKTRKLEEGHWEQRWWIQNEHVYDYDLNFWITQHKELQMDGMDIGRIANGGILKIKYPFRFIPPKGYGLMFHDPFYHFRKDIRCLNGLVKSDEWGFITFPFEILKDNFEIEAGAPMVHVYLVKLETEKLTVNARPATEDEYKDNEFVFMQDTLAGTNYKTRKEPYKRKI